jgi:hypothetical protein
MDLFLFEVLIHHGGTEDTEKRDIALFVAIVHLLHRSHGLEASDIGAVEFPLRVLRVSVVS